MTYTFGLIGHPIGHSLSPWIHQQFIEKCHLSGTYQLFEIEPGTDFSAEMQLIKEKELDGFNITVPYKETILNFLDDVDASARNIGAVNTVDCKNAKWIGYNTDGIGFVRSLISSFPELQKSYTKKILILGAGGAAKGVYHGLLEFGYDQITIANRTTKKAYDITNHRHPVIDLKEAEACIGKFDIIIQTTSVGMKPNIDQAVIPLKGIKDDVIISDIVYQPIKTKFLKEAEFLGANIHLGHKMLLFQAEAAFRIWTAKQPDLTGIEAQLQKVLKG